MHDLKNTGDKPPRLYTLYGLPLHIKHGDHKIAGAALNGTAWDVSLPLHAVKVKLEKGHVTQTGIVGQYCQKHAADWHIRPLMGVTGVTNAITAKMQPNSLTISDDIRHALHRSWMLGKNIRVRATGGKAQLTANVENWHGRELAAATASAAPEAMSVSNEISVG